MNMDLEDIKNIKKKFFYDVYLKPLEENYIDERYSTLLRTTFLTDLATFKWTFPLFRMYRKFHKKFPEYPVDVLVVLKYANDAIEYGVYDQDYFDKLVKKHLDECKKKGFKFVK